MEQALEKANPQICLRSVSRNCSRRQAFGLPFEAILWMRRQVLQVRQFHVVGDLSKPQTWSNTSMKQAFSRSTPTHRESSGVKPSNQNVSIMKESFTTSITAVAIWGIVI
jgi:hypothetical protein